MERTRFRRVGAIGAVLSLAIVLNCGPLTAAPSAAVAQIESQARYWEQKGRFDLARESWLKLQRIDPQSSTALAGLALAEIRAGRPKAAQQYLAGLRALDPNHPALPRVEAMLVSGPEESTKATGELEKARLLAQQGKYDESVAEYQKFFGARGPDDRIALEYWQTLAGAEGGWSEARKGLEDLLKRRPGNANYQLALAQHLTYREATRRQGLDMLESLATGAHADQQVQGSWRQALLWMGSKPSDRKYFQAYLDRYGDDSQIRSGLKEAVASRGVGKAPKRASRIDSRGLALRQAWRLFDDGQTEAAEQAFTSLAEKNRGDAEAWAGLGVVKLRQERYSEARKLLDHASKISPGRAYKWRSARSSARFWEAMRVVETERAEGNLSAAERRLRQALKSEPAVAATEPSAFVLLGDLIAAQGRPGEAQLVYQKVLARQADHAPAIRGLLGVLAKQGRPLDALAHYRQLRPEVQQAVGSASYYEALALRQQAEQAASLGDDFLAEQLLKQALSIDPAGNWPKLDLARLYLAQNRRDEARSLVDGLPVSGPAKGEGAYIRALIAAEDQSWYDALMWLEQVPESERTPEMLKSQHQVWVRYQSERAAVFARNGYQDKALMLLADLEARATSPQLIGATAFAYVEADHQGRALHLLRQAISQSDSAHPDLLEAYAGLLLKLGQYTEFDLVLSQLLGRQDLDRRQKGAVIEMRIAQRLRQADAARQAGNIARAYDLLEPALRANAQDPRLVMALAQLYDEAGEHARSISLYRYALELEPHNLDAYQGVIQASLAEGEERQANQFLSKAFQIAPESSRLHVLAARIAKARGQDGRALRMFRKALALGPGSDGAPGTGSLRLQYLDSQLRPIHYFGTTQRIGAASARLTDLAARNTGGRLIKVGGLADSGRGSGSGTSQPQLPKLYPPGYVPPAAITESAPNLPLKMDMPSSFNPPEGNRPLILRQDPVLDSRNYAYEQAEVPSTPVDEILREIAELTATRSPWAGVGFGLRSRDGRSGLDRLDDVEVPIEVSFPGGGDGGRYNLRVVPVYADAGTLSGSQLPLFGTLALSTAVDSPDYRQDDSGLAIGAAYEIGSLSVDIGSSPLGFQVPVFVGGIAWKPQLGSWSFGVDVSRRSVTDSLLSYAGALDPGSGQEFGGVTATGGRLDIAYDYGRSGLYATSGFQVYQGENVSDNHRANLGGGAFFHVRETRLSRLTIGADITAFFFDENLRHFTLGHGGYFSPQHYVSLSVPVSWAGGHDRFSWKAFGSIGLQSFREDGASLFPDNAGLQADVEQFAIDNPDPVIATGYGGRSSTGSVLSFGGRMEYRIAPSLVLGASAAFDNARDYDETRAQVYLRWHYSGQHAVKTPPEPIRSFADYGRQLP